MRKPGGGFSPLEDVNQRHKGQKLSVLDVLDLMILWHDSLLFWLKISYSFGVCFLNNDQHVGWLKVLLPPFGSHQLHRQAEDYTSSCATEIECGAWSLGVNERPKQCR